MNKMAKEYWLIDLKGNKCLNYCRVKNIKEAEKIFYNDAETENYKLSNCAITTARIYYN